MRILCKLWIMNNRNVPNRTSEDNNIQSLLLAEQLCKVSKWQSCCPLIIIRPLLKWSNKKATNNPSVSCIYLLSSNHNAFLTGVQLVGACFWTEWNMLMTELKYSPHFYNYNIKPKCNIGPNVVQSVHAVVVYMKD